MTAVLDTTVTADADTFTMDAKQLGRMLANATLAASKDKIRPILNSVHMVAERKDNKLTLAVESTDSYWLYRETFESDSEGEDFALDVVLNVSDLAPIVKHLATWNSEVLVKSDVLAVTFTTLASAFTVFAYDGEFPNVRQFIDGFKPGTECSPLGVNANLIVKIAKVQPTCNKVKASETLPMRIEVGETNRKPMRITWPANDDITAILMPTWLH